MYDPRIAFDNRAHVAACGLGVLRFVGGHNRHENSVHAFFGQVAKVAVDKFCRKANGVAGDGVKAVLVHRAV